MLRPIVQLAGTAAGDDITYLGVPGRLGPRGPRPGWENGTAVGVPDLEDPRIPRDVAEINGPFQAHPLDLAKPTSPQGPIKRPQFSISPTLS